MTDSPTTRQIIDAMARAYYEWATCDDGDASRWDDDSPSGEQARRFARARAEVMLAVLLAEQPCPECGGTGGTWDMGCPYPCPSCAGSGTVPGVPALVELLMESSGFHQIGWTHNGQFATANAPYIAEAKPVVVEHFHMRGPLPGAAE